MCTFQSYRKLLWLQRAWGHQRSLGHWRWMNSWCRLRPERIPWHSKYLWDLLIAWLSKEPVGRLYFSELCARNSGVAYWLRVLVGISCAIQYFMFSSSHYRVATALWGCIAPHNCARSLTPFRSSWSWSTSTKASFCSKDSWQASRLTVLLAVFMMKKSKFWQPFQHIHYHLITVYSLLSLIWCVWQPAKPGLGFGGFDVLQDQRLPSKETTIGTQFG